MCAGVLAGVPGLYLLDASSIPFPPAAMSKNGTMSPDLAKRPPQVRATALSVSTGTNGCLFSG